MANDFIKIQGFKDFNQKLKRLPDKIKRTEVLKIQRKLSKPLALAYASNLPIGTKKHTRITKSKKFKSGRVVSGVRTEYNPGNLKRSVRIKTVSARKVAGNPQIQILPDKKGDADGYYRFMVVNKGFKGSGKGSRAGKNTVVTKARNKTAAANNSKIEKAAVIKVSGYIQRQINKL